MTEICNMNPSFLSICTVLVAISVLLFSLDFHQTLSADAFPNRVLTALYQGSVLLYLAFWATALSLSCKTLPADWILVFRILRWCTGVTAVFSIAMALFIHEWYYLLGAVSVAVGFPFFDLVFGDFWCYVFFLSLIYWVAAAFTRLYRCELEQQKSLTLSSIQEGLDALPDGLLFAEADGSILLCNEAMRSLCRSLSRGALGNAHVFWASLENYVPTELVQKSAANGDFLFRFAGGHPWAFHREPLTIDGRTYFQMIALDIHACDEVTQKISQKKAELALTAEKLREVEDTICRLRQEEARIRESHRVHQSITDRMTALYRFFSESYAGSAGSKLDYAKLSPLIDGLLNELGNTDEITASGQIETTISALSLIGVTVFTFGTLPTAPELADAFAFIFREAAINAVRHGHASVIRLRFTEDTAGTLLSVSNNGQTLSGAFVPGGGFTAMRKRLFPLNGTLNLEKEPVFTLSVSIPHP